MPDLHEECNKIEDAVQKAIGTDAKIIVSLWKKQPQTRDALKKSTGTSRRLKNNLCRLTKIGIIKKGSDGKYALYNYSEDEKEIEEAIIHLKTGTQIRLPLVVISILDISKISGIPPNIVEKYAYRLALKHGIEIGEESVSTPKGF